MGTFVRHTCSLGEGDPPRVAFPCKGPAFPTDDEQPPELVADVCNVDVEDLEGGVEDLAVALDDLSVGVKGQKLTLPLELGTEDALPLR